MSVSSTIRSTIYAIAPNSNAWKAVAEKVPAAISITSKALSDTGALQKIMQITVHALKGLGFIFGKAQPFPIETLFGKGISVINALDFIPDSYDFLKIPFDKKNGWKIAGFASSLCADVGSIVQLLDEVEIIRVGRIAASFGAVEVASELPKVALGNAVTAFAGAANLFLAVDSAKKVFQAENPTEKTKSLLDLSFHVSKVAFSAFLLLMPSFMNVVGATASATATTMTLGPIILGIAAAALGLTAFFYKKTREV